jgi:hypothetical protein
MVSQRNNKKSRITYLCSCRSVLKRSSHVFQPLANDHTKSTSTSTRLENHGQTNPFRLHQFSIEMFLFFFRTLSLSQSMSKGSLINTTFGLRLMHVLECDQFRLKFFCGDSSPFFFVCVCVCQEIYWYRIMYDIIEYICKLYFVCFPFS